MVPTSTGSQASWALWLSSLSEGGRGSSSMGIVNLLSKVKPLVCPDWPHLVWSHSSGLPWVEAQALNTLICVNYSVAKHNYNTNVESLHPSKGLLRFPLPDSCICLSLQHSIIRPSGDLGFMALLHDWPRVLSKLPKGCFHVHTLTGLLKVQGHKKRENIFKNTKWGPGYLSHQAKLTYRRVF